MVPSPFPVMEDMTVKEVRAYLARRQSILIPIGVIEQHGYHLPLSTDALIATGLGRRVGERVDMIVAPTMIQSFSGGGLPGTINISPATMAQVMQDMLLSLLSQGFRNFYLLLCHGGSENMGALEDGVKVMLRTNPAFANALVALLPVWKFNSPGIGWDKALKEKDWHAGWLETSIVMALAPDKVRMDELALDEEPYLTMQRDHPDMYQHAESIVDDEFAMPRLSQRPEIQVGVMGDPAQATPEKGEAIVADLVAKIAAKIAALEAQADGEYKEIDFSPPPIVL